MEAIIDTLMVKCDTQVNMESELADVCVREQLVLGRKAKYDERPHICHRQRASAASDQDH